MVLAASGVEHEELLSIAEPLLSDLPKVPSLKVPESAYVGGDYRRQADCGVCINYKYVLYYLFIIYLQTMIQTLTEVQWM